ncbi:hypothetical protein AQUCO_00201302v1 [Aquilegia coerulea]|uniref:Zinc finger PHD-type domain-containing protein n=2 Tax=Aquilegia coerulea TaxID=218851 RepID=A0A2G5F7A4_AQUCA|nr:hypothetical protein AQUCO_00201302v1 [Aquilegia coerulea]
MTPSMLKTKNTTTTTTTTSGEQTNNTALAWDWVIGFLADLEHIDANFLDDLLSNVPHGYSSLSNNVKDKVALKHLEKIVALPRHIPPTHAERRRILIAPSIYFAINPSEPARDFYERLMSKRGLDASNLQDNMKVGIHQFILQKRAGLPKCTLPKQAEVLVECHHASGKRPNVSAKKSAKVKKVHFADHDPTVYPVASAISSPNHCTMVDEITPRVSETLIENIQEAPSEDIIVSGKRRRSEFTKGQLIDLDGAETMHVDQSSDCLGPFTVEGHSGGILSSIQNEATNTAKDHVVSKKMKKSMNDGQMEHCGSGITCNDNNMPQEVIFDGCRGKSSVDETRNGSGNQTDLETSTDLNKAHLSYANEVLEIAMMNGQSSPMTLEQESPETDLTKENNCVRCQKGDQLLICDTCSLIIHDNCLGAAASFNSAGNFICPVCLHSQAKTELEEVKKKYALAKKKFVSARDCLLKFINKEYAHEKIVPSETVGELNGSHVVGNGKFHDGIDANGKRKEIVKNQAIVSRLCQQEAEMGIGHAKTPHGVPFASPISDSDIASITDCIQQKQVNNRVDGEVVKTPLEISSVQCHGNFNEREKRTNIRVGTSDASNLQQPSVNAPKSAAPYLSVEKHADVGKKNVDLQELPVNAPNGPSTILGAETKTGSSPQRPSYPSEENVENKAENEKGERCFEMKKRHSPMRRKSSRQTVNLPHRPSSPSNENVDEVPENGNGDESDSGSKSPARRK